MTYANGIVVAMGQMPYWFVAVTILYTIIKYAVMIYIVCMTRKVYAHVKATIKYPKTAQLVAVMTTSKQSFVAVA